MSAPVFGSLPIRTANPGDVVVYLASPSGTASLGTENNPLVVQNAAASEVQVTNTVGVTGTIGLNSGSVIAIDQSSDGVTNKVNASGSVLRLADATMANILNVDTHGSSQTSLYDVSGNPFGTSGNPIYVSSTAASGTQNVDVLNTVAVSLATALPSGANTIGNVGLVDTNNNPLGTSGNPISISINQLLPNANVVTIQGQTQTELIDSSSNPFGTSANPIYVSSTAASGTQNVDVLNTVAVSGAISLLGTSAVSGTIAIDQTTPGANNVEITGVASVQLFDASSNPFGTSGNPIYVDVSNSVGTQAVSGSITIGTSLPSGANLIGSVDVANTVAVSGSVNIGGAGLGSSSSNPLYVSTGAGTSGALFNSGQLSTSVAGGLSATLATAPFSAGVAASLVNLVVAGSAAARYDFQVVDNSGTPTTIFSMFTTASQPNAIFKPYVDGEIISAAADGTNAKYQVVVNNVDVVTTNFYAYMAWSQP